MEIDRSFNELLELEIDKLYPKGIEIRYPEFTAIVTRDEAREAIEIAERVRMFILKRLGDENL